MQHIYAKSKDLCSAFIRYATATGNSELKILNHPTLLAKKFISFGLTEKVNRATGNTKCFMDIILSEEKLSSFIEEKNQADMRQNTFENVLDSLSNLIQFEEYTI